MTFSRISLRCIRITLLKPVRGEPPKSVRGEPKPVLSLSKGTMNGIMGPWANPSICKS